MFASSIPAITAAIAIATGPAVFSFLLDDEPPSPVEEDPWSFDEEAWPNDDLFPEDDASPAGDRGVDASGRAREDDPPEAEASPTGEPVPAPIHDVARDLHPRWARLLPRLSIAVSGTYRDQDQGASRSAELALWLWLSWSFDARAMHRSVP